MKNYICILLLICTIPLFAQQKDNEGNPTSNNTSLSEDTTKSPVVVTSGESESDTVASISPDLLINLDNRSVASRRIKYKKTRTGKEALDAGKAAARDKSYAEAINYYFGAEAYDPKLRNEVRKEVEKAFIEITKLRDIANIEKDKALVALEIAREQRALAIEKEQEAIEQRKEADAARIKADSLRVMAEEQKKIAEEQKKIAEQERQKAVENEGKARTAEQKAVRLRKEAIVSVLATKSLDIEYDNRLQGLLALEAFKQYEDLFFYYKPITSKIYNAMHNSLNNYEINAKNEGFDEIRRYHIGGVTSILQKGENEYYTTGGDGKFIKWQWKDSTGVGRPAIQFGVGVDDGFSKLCASMSEDGQWIVLGSRARSLQLIEIEKINYQQADTTSQVTIQIDSTMRARKQKRQQAKKLRLELLEEMTHNGVTVDEVNEALEPTTYDIHKNATVSDVQFYKSHIISIGRDNHLRAYNPDTKQDVVLKTLNDNANHFEIHPDGHSIAIGYQSGLLEVYSVRDFTKQIVEKPYMSVQLEAPITALGFDEHRTNHRLVAGLKNGYLHVYTEQQNDTSRYSEYFHIAKKAHKLRISTIAFRPENSTNKFDLAIGSYDGAISLWKLTALVDPQYEPLRLNAQDTWVTSLYFDKYQPRLIAGHLDGRLKFWSLDTKALANALWCRHVKTEEQLNIDEKLKYVGNGIPLSNHLLDCK